MEYTKHPINDLGPARDLWHQNCHSNTTKENPNLWESLT